MPQPLDKLVGRTARLQWGVGSFPADPKIGALAMEYVSLASNIDSKLNELMAMLLQADVVAITRAFQSITSVPARQAARQAIAEGVLRPIHLEVYKAATEAVDRVQKQRHKFAHHIWAVSPDLSEPHVALINPKHIELPRAKHQELMLAFARGDHRAHENVDILAETSVDRSKVKVYRLGDLERLVRDAKLVAGVVTRMTFVLPPPQRTYVPMRPPEFAELLDQLKRDLKLP